MSAGEWTTKCNRMDIASLEAFTRIRGSSRKDGKDVYFVRALGMSRDVPEQLARMDQELTAWEQAGQGRYSRIDGLPRLTSLEDSAWYGDCYERFRAGGWSLADSRKTQGRPLWQQALGKACRQALALFRELNPQATASMEKNFAAKLFFWFDHTGLDLSGGWEPGMPMKLAAGNISKKPEYLFCYFLALAGIDVLLLQSREDIGQELKQKGWSREFTLGAFEDRELPPYDRAACQEAARKPAPVRVNVRRPDRDQRTKEKPAQRELRQERPSPGGVRRELAFEELALLASSVVMIAIHDEKQEIIGTGSGIMVGRDGYILTNHHVASGGRFYSVRIEDEEKVYPTDEIIKYNSLLDLAVIRIDRELNPLPVYQGEKKLARGQKVVAIGSPLGMFNSVSDGIISGFRHFENVDMIQFTAPTSHGSSGGAVLNMYGEVIGISTAGMDNGQNINLAVGYEWINNFIRGLT